MRTLIMHKQVQKFKANRRYLCQFRFDYLKKINNNNNRIMAKRNNFGQMQCNTVKLKLRTETTHKFKKTKTNGTRTEKERTANEKKKMKNGKHLPMQKFS